jgi:membrane fusion protein, multidrug efflux system
MKRKRFFLSAVALAMVLAACSQKSAQNSPQQAPAEVLVTKVNTSDVPIHHEWVATLDGSVNVNIQARVQGYLVKQAYNEGTPVKKGDLLFEIDARPFQAVLAPAKAALSSAQATAVNAALDEKRQNQLIKSSATSEATRDSAVQASAAAKAAVEAAEAAVEQAQLNLDFCHVTAPIDGIAGIAKPGIGDLVGPNGTALTTISTVDPIQVSFQLSERDYLFVAQRINENIKNQVAATPTAPTLELILANGTVYPLKGKYSKINRQVDSKTGTIEIGTLFPNPDNILRPGQFARIRALTSVRHGAILVPARAIYEMQGMFLAAIVDAQGKAQIRPVTATEQIGSQWIVEKGLQDGDTLVVDGFLKVKSGAPVNAKPWTPAPTQTQTGAN